MGHVGQKLRVISATRKKGNSKKEIIFINRQSRGTIWINGVPHTYNSKLVYHDDVTFDQIIEDSQPRGRRVIVIRRR